MATKKSLKHSKAMQNAADEARMDERRMICNYLNSVPYRLSRDVAKDILEGKHVDIDNELDPR